MKRRTEITIETDRVVVLEHVARKDTARWCERCGALSRLIAPEEAAALLGIGTQAILRWADAANLHFAESADGQTLLCLDSLSRSSPCTTPPT